MESNLFRLDSSCNRLNELCRDCHWPASSKEGSTVTRTCQNVPICSNCPLMELLRTRTGSSMPPTANTRSAVLMARRSQFSVRTTEITDRSIKGHGINASGRCMQALLPIFHRSRWNGNHKVRQHTRPRTTSRSRRGNLAHRRLEFLPISCALHLIPQRCSHAHRLEIPMSHLAERNDRPFGPSLLFEISKLFHE